MTLVKSVFDFVSEGSVVEAFSSLPYEEPLRSVAIRTPRAPFSR